MGIQQHKIFMWNRRGAESKAFFPVSKQYMVANKHDIIIIMETRFDHANFRKTFSLLVFDGYKNMKVMGFTRGILIT